MSVDARFLDSGYRGMSGAFRYDSPERMTFIWDGAAVRNDGRIVLVEEELSRPVPLHIQGHVSRAALMQARGEPLQKLVWVVREADLARLWSIVEPWRQALQRAHGIGSPPCEYRDARGRVLTLSPDFE